MAIMGYLLRKMLRDIRHNAGQYVAITIVIMIGVACYVGMMSVSGSVSHSIDHFYSTQNLADLWVRLPYVEESSLAQIRDLPGVASADARIATTGTSGAHTFTIHAITSPPPGTVPAMDTGHLPQSGTDCIVDRGYARANHLGIGAVISVRIGEANYHLSVVGIFNSPEYLYLAQDITSQPDHLTYGALFVATNLLPTSADNEIVVRAQPRANLAQVRSQISQIALPGGDGILLDRTQLLSWAMLNQDITQYGQIGAVFPILFFVVAAAVISISMSKNVETQRNHIGTMKALGISGGLITFHFLSYTLMTCLIGCLLGVLAGLLGVMPGIQRIFTAYYTMPATQASGFGVNIVVATGLAFAFAIVATALSVRRPLRESPAATMRPKPPRTTHGILLERTLWWSRLSYGSKIVWRNLFYNKARALASSVGIIGCVALLLASFSFLDSIGNVLGPRFDAMNQYDIAVTPASPVPVGTTLPLVDADIVSVTPQASAPASFSVHGQIVSTNLTALEADSNAIALFDSKGSRLSFPSDGVIIPQLFSQHYGLAISDTITVTVAPPDATPTQVSLHVVAIAVEYLQQDIYTSFDYLAACDLILPASTFYLSVRDATAPSVTAALSTNQAVSQAITKADLAHAWSSEMSILNSMVWIMIAASAVLALAVVYNISAINIFERRRDIATLKVLGYHRGEINRLVDRENLIITGFGAILGIPVGIAMLWLIIRAVVSDTMMVPMVISPLSVLYAVALGFAFTVVANHLVRTKIRQINMVESLKSVE